MDDTIKVGDLVVVVKPSPCCGRDDGVGVVFTVADISTSFERCSYCDVGSNDTNAWRDSLKGEQLWRLRRITPLAADCTTFEDWFGTEEEHRLEMERMRMVDEKREAECVIWTRQRCHCGAPSLFVDEKHGPLCAPCGYHYAN